MATPLLIRDDEADIRVSVQGKPYFESWLSYKGGGLTATSAASRSGGMGRERKAGGPRVRSDIEVTIDLDDVVIGFHNEFEAFVGWGQVDVSVQYLHPDRTAIPGAHFTRSGVLVGAMPSDIDGETNSPNVGKYTITVSAHELAG